MRTVPAIPLVLLLLGAAPLGAQFPPTRTRNLQVLPKDIPIRALIDTMRGFTRALGVRCTYCHVGEEGQPLDSFDFAADTKEAKLKARVMLGMVEHINGEHLDELPSRREPRIAVTCATCHRGVAQPRPLQQLLLTAYDSGGVDSTLGGYQALRARYYGRAAYDFGEVTLVDVAQSLRDRGRLADAVRLYVLNTEVNPTSGFAFRQAAEGHAASGDTASAIASLEKALAINDKDRQAREALEKLRAAKP